MLFKPSFLEKRGKSSVILRRIKLVPNPVAALIRGTGSFRRSKWVRAWSQSVEGDVNLQFQVTVANTSSSWWWGFERRTITIRPEHLLALTPTSWERKKWFTVRNRRLVLYYGFYVVLPVVKWWSFEGLSTRTCNHSPFWFLFGR
jgi:hypothetical protein